MPASMPGSPKAGCMCIILLTTDTILANMKTMGVAAVQMPRYEYSLSIFVPTPVHLGVWSVSYSHIRCLSAFCFISRPMHARRGH